MPNPHDNPELYDVIVLAGLESPGVWKFSGAPKRSEGWDKQEPKGSDGGETVRKNRPLMEFGGTLKLWKEDAGGPLDIDHFLAWESWKQILQTPIAKGASKALDIYHPQLEDLDCTSVVVKSWTQPDPQPDGSAIVTLEFIEYAPAKKRPPGSGKPKGSVAGPGNQPGGSPTVDPAPDPNKDLKDKIDAKLAEDASL